MRNCQRTRYDLMLLLSFIYSIISSKNSAYRIFLGHLNVTSYHIERLCDITMCGVKLRCAALLQCCDALEQMC